MDGTPRSIGATSRESGLSVSALRFYDGAGVLRPARVDPVTGYRWYTAEQVSQARLIAALRQAGLPLVAICGVLASRHNRAAAEGLLDTELRRLEDGLAAARRHLDAARALLGGQQPATALTVLGRDLTRALTAVRFAVSGDPALPALGGVLFDCRGGQLSLVASDRYRLAVAAVPVSSQDGPDARVIAPLPFVDQQPADPDAPLFLRLGPGTVAIGTAQAAAVDAVFPDYEQYLRKIPQRRVAVDAAELLRRLAAGPVRAVTQAPGRIPHDVSVVRLAGGSVEVLERDQPGAAGFNRTFLAEAISAGRASQLVLAMDDRAAPLAIIDPAQPGHLSLLMPTLPAVTSA